MIVVPFCSLVPAVIIAHTVVGPIGWRIGDAIAAVVNMGLNSNVKWLFAAIFGLVYAPLVMTGLHHMTNAIDSQLVNSFGGTNLWPMIALSNIAQGSAVLAMSVLQRRTSAPSRSMCRPASPATLALPNRRSSASTSSTVSRLSAE